MMAWILYVEYLVELIDQCRQMQGVVSLFSLQMVSVGMLHCFACFGKALSCLFFN